MTRITIRWCILSYLPDNNVNGGIADKFYESFKKSSTSRERSVLCYRSLSIPSDDTVQRGGRTEGGGTLPLSCAPSISPLLHGTDLTSFHTSFGRVH